MGPKAMWYIGESAHANSSWQSGVLSKSSWLESPGLAPQTGKIRQLCDFSSYLRARGWNLPVWRPRPGQSPGLAPRPGESPGLAPQTGKICQLCDFSSYLRARGWNLPVWRPRPGESPGLAPSPGESPGLAPQTGRPGPSS